MGQPIQVTSKTGAKRRDAKFERPALNLLVDRADTEENMYEEIEPKREKCSLVKTLDKILPFVFAFVCGILFTSICFGVLNVSSRQGSRQEPNQITGKFSGVPDEQSPICFENSSQLLTFTHFDLINLIKDENDNEKGIYICGKEERFIYPVQYFFTFEAEHSAVFNCSCFQVTAYHKYGRNGKMELEEMEITGCNVKEPGHSWTWTLYPGNHCDEIWLKVKGDCGRKNCFWNYQLNAVEIKSKY